jgi:hypothetical protein
LDRRAGSSPEARAIVPQIGAGVAAGLLVAGIFEFMSGGNLGGNAFVLFPVVVGVMFGVGLAIEPTDALRNE